MWRRRRQRPARPNSTGNHAAGRGATPETEMREVGSGGPRNKLGRTEAQGRDGLGSDGRGRRGSRAQAVFETRPRVGARRDGARSSRRGSDRPERPPCTFHTAALPYRPFHLGPTQKGQSAQHVGYRSLECRQHAVQRQGLSLQPGMRGSAIPARPPPPSASKLTGPSLLVAAPQG